MQCYNTFGSSLLLHACTFNKASNNFFSDEYSEDGNIKTCLILYILYNNITIQLRHIFAIAFSLKIARYFYAAFVASIVYPTFEYAVQTTFTIRISSTSIPNSLLSVWVNIAAQ